ncbi:MAG: VWA domain-containing protein [Desulfotignum sp.]|nr:VWA domain-containing protein [Desulfotignum sp.]
MTFADPKILFFLWALVPAAWLLVKGVVQRKRILARFADPAVHPDLVPGHDPKSRWIKAGLILAALVLAVFALAGPTMGFRWEKTTAKGVDIMIALDCSRSMLAQDIAPTRLERAKREIIDLLRLMKSDRAGLVAFAGQAVLQCPLTMDHAAFHIFLNVLTPDYLPVGGTNLPAAIEACYNGFEADADTDKAIILITDGENTAGDVSKITEKMADSRIKVFSIGVGDPAGAPIPDPDGGFTKDEQGNIVMSRVDETCLTEIARLTGGGYVRSVAGDMDLDRIYTQGIRGTMEQKTLEQGKKKVGEQRFQWFLFPCVLLLLMELWLPVTRRSRAAGLAAAWMVFALGIGGPIPANAFSNPVQQGVTAYEAGEFQQSRNLFIDAQLENPDDPRLYYNIGAAAYKAGSFEEAEKNFAQAARSQDPELRHKALFNLANTHYRQGRLDEAIKGYASILEAFPDDQKAKENLEFVKQKKQEQEQQQKQQQDGNTQDQDNPKQKNKDQDQEKQGSDSQNNTEGQDQAQQNPENRSLDGQNHDQQDNSQAQNPAGPPPDPKPAQEDQPRGTGDEQEQQAAAAQAQPAAPGNPGDQALENRLNRLEDKPGMALMPVGRPRDIQKDW